ncbi:MAG: tetratricopeptide repeat protein [Gallionellaceae bacterium]
MPTAPIQTEDQLFQIAIQHHQAGRVSQAESIYRQILQNNPDHADALHLLGVLCHQTGNNELAVGSINRAITVDPANPFFYDNLGTVYQALSRLDEAVTSYRKALALDPNFAGAHFNLGNVLQRQGQLDKAVASYQMALALRPDYVDAYISLGNTFKDLGKPEEAIVCYQKSLAFNPNYAEAHFNLGNILCSLEQLVDAAASYRRALEIKPHYAGAHFKLGDVQHKLGQLDGAIASYRRALQIKPELTEAHSNLGSALRDIGQFDEAVASYRRALEIDPNNLGTNFRLGNLLSDLGMLDGAEELFRQCLKIDPEDSLGAQLLLARLGFEQMPARASEAQLSKLYVERSRNWDRKKGSYRAHELVAQALRKLQPNCTLDILDAGCGTGLVGALVRDMASKLDGIDMSAAMLLKAREKGIYDQLYQGDLVSAMAGNPDSYDAITCAATLIHFGDLTTVFAAAASSLRQGGLFIFTVFPNDSAENSKDVVVAQHSGLAWGGCYAHSQGYVRRLAEATGFVVDMLYSETHEYDNLGIPIRGLVVALRRRSKPSAISV